MSDVLPAPERLDGTKSCELAAILVTLGFTPVDRQLTVASGDGIPGGRLGYWRFLPLHPQRRYDLRAVLVHGVDPCQAGKCDDARHPVYREQAYMAAAMHNYRLLIEQVRHGTRLELAPCGYLYLLRRVEAQGVPEMSGKEEVRCMMAAGTRRTELAAGLATLGFEPVAVRQGAGASAGGVLHEGGGMMWMFPQASRRAGEACLGECMARWADDAWSGRADNNAAIACMADCFWNLRHLRKSIAEARRLVRVQNGARSVLLAGNAPQAAWDRAARFLKS